MNAVENSQGEQPVFSERVDREGFRIANAKTESLAGAEQALPYSAPNTETLQLLRVPIGTVEPHPQNPRKTFDATKLQELAGDIKERGILQPLVVRTKPTEDPCPRCDGQGQYRDTLFRADSDLAMRRCEECAGGGMVLHYQLVAGERRWRAAQLAGLETVPVIRRDDMTDQDVLASMMSENIQRADLNPIEQARGLRAMQDSGMKQGVIAQRLGLAQPTIANMLSLLRLPDEVQTLISDGKLSKSHGQALVKWAEYPEACALLAREAVRKSAPSSELEARLPYEDALVHAKCAERYPTGTQPLIESEPCASCQHLRRGSWTAVCLRPQCLQEKVEAYEAGRTERRAQAIDAARAAAHTAATAPSMPAENSESAPRETIAPAPDLPDLADLDWSTYQDMSAGVPAGCTGERCEHYGHVRDYQGNAMPICLNTTCHSNLRNAERVASSEAREAELTVIADDAWKRVVDGPALSVRLILPALANLLAYAAPADIKTGFYHVGMPVLPPELWKYITLAEACDLLQQHLNLARALQLLAWLCLRKELQHGIDRSWMATLPYAHWLTGREQSGKPEQELLGGSLYEDTMRAKAEAMRKAAGLTPLCAEAAQGNQPEQASV